MFPLEPDTPPAPATLAQAEAWASGASEPLFLWEGQPDPALRAALPTPEHIVLDPLEAASKRGEPYDYRMQANANVAHLAALCGQSDDTPAP